MRQELCLLDWFWQKKLVFGLVVFCTQYRAFVRKLTTSGNGWCTVYSHLHLFFCIHAVYPTFCFLYIKHTSYHPSIACNISKMLWWLGRDAVAVIMHLHYCRFYIIVDYNWKGDICWPVQGIWSIWSGGVIISGIRCSSGQCQWTEEAGIGHRGQGNSYTDQYEIACEPSHHQRDKIHDYRLNDRMGGRGSQRCCSYSEPPLSC